MTDKMAAYARCVCSHVCVCVKWLVGILNTLASAVEGVQLARLRPDFLNISNKLHKINRPREQTQCARAIRTNNNNRLQQWWMLFCSNNGFSCANIGEQKECKQNVNNYSHGRKSVSGGEGCILCWAIDARCRSASQWVRGTETP